MFDDYDALASRIDEKAGRRLVRKLYIFIIPFIRLTYLITYIDKATLSFGMMCPFSAVWLETMLTIFQAANKMRFFETYPATGFVIKTMPGLSQMFV
jgi:hypothetical protein